MLRVQPLSSEPDWKAFYQRKYDEHMAELYDFTEEIIIQPTNLDLDEVRV